MKAQDIIELFNKIQISDNLLTITGLVNPDNLLRLILISKDNNGLAHIYIEAKEGFVDFDELKGIGIVNKKYNIKGFKDKNFYEYSCRHIKFHIIFFPFISDVISKIEDGTDIISAHKSCMRLWKHCFEDPDINLLPENREIGLLGELLFLRQLLDHKLDAVEYWNGPAGGVDFVFENKLIEVKTTIKDTHQHTVNGINQLEHNESATLYLNSIILQKVDDSCNGYVALSSVFIEIMEFLSNDPVSVNRLLYKLQLLGLSENIMLIHNFRKYLKTDDIIFPVNDDFPKIVNKSFKEPLASRISKVNYDINLDGLKYISFKNLMN